MARIRFRPPKIEPSEELDWLLLAAFSEQFPAALGAGCENAALSLAERLGLAVPIGARLQSTGLRESLPESMAERFRRAHAHSAIRAVMHERAARQIEETTQRMSIPLVFLKGFALFIAGRDRSGGRPIGDLDILVPEASAKSLHAELRHRGYGGEGETGNEHHLASLISPEGSNIDLHFCIRGLSFEGTTWATWTTLEEHQALVPAEGYSSHCSILDIEVLTAHLLVHGLAHHAWRPHTYPLLRLVGDLLELLPDAQSWQDFLRSYLTVLLHAVHEPELQALRELTLGLGAGRVPDLASSRPNDGALLLRHILAGYLVPSYGDRLRLRHTLGRLADAARQGRLWGYLARKTGSQRVD